MHWEAFFLTSLAGLSTSLGGLIVCFFPAAANDFKLLGRVLGFSSGVMIYISFVDLLPEAIPALGWPTAQIAFFLGMLFFFGMTLLIPESGHGEHSHAHSKAAAAASEPSGSPRSSPVRRRRGSVGSAAERSGEKEKPKKRGGKAVAKSAEQRRLLRVGLDTALGIALHNIPEGIAVYLASLSGMQVGAALAVAIAAHNIPEGMAVAAPVLTATGSRFRAILSCTVSGLCEPIAALIVGTFFASSLSEERVQFLLAGVAGVMVLISILELIPTCLRYISANEATVSHVLGMAFMAANICYLHHYIGFHGHSHSHDIPSFERDHHHHHHHHHDYHTG